jgi:hypothetical protein
MIGAEHPAADRRARGAENMDFPARPVPPWTDTSSSGPRPPPIFSSWKRAWAAVDVAGA